MENSELELLKKIKYGLFSWIDFIEDGHILCIDEELGALPFLRNNNLIVDYCTNDTLNTIDYKYDYILWREATFNSKKLNKIYSMLSERGVAFLGVNNINAIKKYVGDSSIKVEYTKTNIIDTLLKSDFKSYKIYSVFPNLIYPQFIISDDYFPNENMSIRYMPYYDNPNEIYIDERILLDRLIDAKVFHEFANGYLIECHKNNDEIEKYNHITLSMERVDGYACNTLVKSDIVIKKYPFDANDKINKALVENEKYLVEHNVPIIKSIKNKEYVVPYINANTLTHKLYELIKNNKDDFYALFDRYKDIIYSSSKVISDGDNGPVLERCYIDLVPLNCLWYDDNFLFIDQEFYLNNMDANIIIWRSVKILLLSYPDIGEYITENDLLNRYNIDVAHAKEYSKISNNFLYKLRNGPLLEKYYKNHFINENKLLENNKKVKNVLKSTVIEKNKKYKVGYIAGVFDLFHIGHLNLIRKAKEMCDYLIVGVVSDRGVRENKKIEPIIPFEDRIEIVRSCKYVDEANEIPFEHCTTIDAYQKYHFDVQFSGSDYENDQGWLYMKKYLEEHGSKLIFLPYTEKISSTKIKKLINDKTK